MVNRFWIAILLAVPHPSWALGGVDETWSWRSSSEADGPPVSWADLDSYADATDLGLGTGDSTTIKLPFAFPFYGTEYSEVTVYAYGVVVPGAPSSDPGEQVEGQCLSDGDYAGPLIAPLWSTFDLDVGGGVYVATYDDAVIIEWSDVYVESDDTGAQQVGVTLFSSGEIGFIYQKTSTGDTDTRSGRSATSGVQSGDGDFVELGCESSYISTSLDSIYLSPLGFRHLVGSFSVVDVADATVQGDSSSDRFGYSLSGVDDVDGDGSDEVLIGAPYADDGGSNSGTAYLFDGASLQDDIDVDTALATITGDSSSDYAGFSVAGVADVDGDGLGDVLVGAPYSDEGASNAGAAAFFSGGLLSGALQLTDADALLTGRASSDYAGWNVSGAGDVDGDGYQDLLIGAPNNDDGATNGGSAYLVFGASSVASLSLSAADASWYGDDASDYAGIAVAALGDVNGDGLDDFGIGAYGDDGGGTNAGAVAVVFGDASLSGSAAFSSEVEIAGAASGDAAGFALSGLGDGDGDGYADVLIGSYTAGSANNGAVALVSGRGRGWVSDLGSSDGQLTGASSDRLGSALTGFDLDGEGQRAVLSGAYGNSDGASAAGAVYLASADQLPDAPTTADARLTLLGSDSSGYLGQSVAAADISGDGFDDVIAGAYGADGAESASGVVYIVNGRPTYPDADGDGHISTAHGGVDCDDSNPDQAPGQSDTCDGLDNDCDGVVDEGYGDGDGDGIADCVDTEECDGLDNDGDGDVDEDMADTDGDGTCDAIDVEDCDGLDNDGDGTVDEGFNDADSDGIADCIDTETCDGIDNNGDGNIDEGFADTDGDGTADCVDGETCDGLDNDGDGDVDEDYPDTDSDGTADCVDFETCDGLDNDGDGTIDEGLTDTDGDGFCDDIDVEECDGLDNDGDGMVDEDFVDGDGDGVADCVDGETCDGIDNNGNGSTDEGYADTDGDGIADCVDTEECDGIDNDGDGRVDEGFADTDFDSIADCIDVETCDGIDNNGDGTVDEGFSDVDADSAADCIDMEECDGIDNDGDGVVDEGFVDDDGDGTASCVDGSPHGDILVTEGGCSTGPRPHTMLGIMICLLGIHRRKRG